MGENLLLPWLRTYLQYSFIWAKKNIILVVERCGDSEGGKSTTEIGLLNVHILGVEARWEQCHSIFCALIDTLSCYL